MSGNDIFGELDDRTETPSSNSEGDYADWWEPDTEGDRVVGVIVELHSEPQEWTDPGDVPKTVRTVMSVGRGDLEAGETVTPKQHRQLLDGLEDTSIGDLVQLKFTGYEKVNGNPMHTYEVGTLTQEEWEALDGADEMQEYLDDYSGISGDNRRTEPYTSVGGSSGGDSSGSPAGGESELGQAASALNEVLDIQNGSLPVDQAEKVLTDIRGFDVELEEAAAMAGVTIEDGTVKR